MWGGVKKQPHFGHLVGEGIVGAVKRLKEQKAIKKVSGNIGVSGIR